VRCVRPLQNVRDADPTDIFQTLTRLGSNTTGIDASQSNIAIASLHASADPSIRLSTPPLASEPPSDPSTARPGRGTMAYEHTSVEELLARRGPKQFDVVCSMEVVEHVDNPRAFLSNCAELVKVRTVRPPSARIAPFSFLH